MSNKSLTALIVGVVVVIAAWNCFYIVAQTERAVLLQFGRVVQADVQPGLHVKVPYVNQVRKFDARLMTLDAPTQRFLTLEKKAVMVDAYAKWRVKDAERFYTATSGLKQIADERLSRRLESGLRDQFGKRTLHEVVSGERDALMADITRSLNTMAEKELGIEVVDVRVKAIDLPKEVNRSVFERVSTAPRVTSWLKVSVPMPTVSVVYCWQKPTASLKRRVVMAMLKPRRSTPRPTARTRSSTRSTVACAPTVKASRTKPTYWCWTQAATSSATWKSPSNQPVIL